MAIPLERKDLIDAQEMQVAVNGPDGATHLILCTGVAELGAVRHEIYTFHVGPQVSRRQFVDAIASGALSSIQGCDTDCNGAHNDGELGATLISIDANYDDKHGRVKVSAAVSSSIMMTKLAISYNVNILAELLKY